MTKTKSTSSKTPLTFKDTSFEELKNALIKAGQVKLSAVAMEGDLHVQKLLEKWRQQERNREYGYEFRFGMTLNRATYLFFEDPSDGYRSYLGNVLRVTGFRLHNHFTPLVVNVADSCAVGTPSQGLNSDGFQLLCRRTGGLIAEVGTDNYDDYYPTCLAYFDPQVLEVAQLDNLPQASSGPRSKLRL